MNRTFLNLLVIGSLLFVAKITATAQFSGGDGTENNPFIITTAEQLAQLATYVNAGTSPYANVGMHYKLNNDIDLSDYQAGESWHPIGWNDSNPHSKPFSGVFNGNNKKITNLYIHSLPLMGGSYAGLFGWIENGTVKNLGVENVDINIGGRVGGVVGRNDGGIISNCYTTGSVNAGGAGGVIGLNYQGSVSNCYSKCTVIGNVAGGVVAYNTGNLSNCYSTGSITASYNGIETGFAGGIAGHNYGGSISYCYSIGIVSASGYNSCVGGIVGYNYVGYIEDCSSLNSKITGSPYYNGRVVGRNLPQSQNLSNNIAFNNIINPNNNTIWPNKGLDQLDGGDITISSIYSDGTLGGRFTNDGGWTTKNGRLPGLFGETVEMPEHLRLQNFPYIITPTLPNGIAGIEYNQTLSAEGSLTIEWTLENGNLPNGLSLAANGTISGIPTNAGTYIFTVKATNNVGSDTQELFIVVNEPPIILTTNLPSGKTETSYNHTLSASGDSPIIWSLENGNLPEGLELSEDGIISGIPTVANTFNFTVKATNNFGYHTKELSIIVIAPDSPPIIITETLPNGETGIVYNKMLETLSITSVTWSLENGSLPNGLNLSSGGSILGVPTERGVFIFVVKATNNFGSDTKELSIIVVSTGYPTITTTNLPDGKIGEIYNETLEVLSDSPVIWSLENGNLPTGLSLSTNGEIVGIPSTLGTFNFTVKATNSIGINTKGLSILIKNLGDPPIITTETLPSGTVGIEYSQTLTAIGNAPIIWSLIDNILPSNLVLSENGLISGVPTNTGTFSFTVKATNSFGNDIKELSIVIIAPNSPPVITTKTLESGTVGAEYSQTLTAIGDTPIFWGLEAGVFPSGLNLFSSGLISGIPITAGTYTFTVKATNSFGDDTKELSIIVVTPDSPPVITTENLPNATIGTEYSQTLTAIGDTPIFWGLEAGVFPSGLNLFSNGIIEGTPIVAGTFTFTVKSTNSFGDDIKELSINVIAPVIPPVITTENLPNGTVGTQYNQTLTATGNTPITWTIESGTLPPGLNAFSNGIISGVPFVEGAFNFIIKAINNAGVDTKEFLVVINPNSSILDNSHTQTLTAFFQNGTLYVNGLIPGELWCVYNMAGVLVYEDVANYVLEKLSSKSLKISSGIYIVRAGNRTTKFFINEFSF